MTASKSIFLLVVWCFSTASSFVSPDGRKSTRAAASIQKYRYIPPSICRSVSVDCRDPLVAFMPSTLKARLSSIILAAMPDESDEDIIATFGEGDEDIKVIRGTGEEITDELWDDIEGGAPSQWDVMKQLLGINIFTYILAAAIVVMLSLNALLGPGWLGQSLGLEGTGTFTEMSDSLPGNIDLNQAENLL